MIAIGDKVHPKGVFDIPLRVMGLLHYTESAITVHWQEWAVLQTDVLDRYATVHAIKLKELEEYNEHD